jgi:adenine-specific DNA-methyltransferase
VPFHAPNVRPNLTYPIITPSGRILMPPPGRCWSTTKEKFAELLADNRIYFGKDGSGMAQRKKFWSEREEGMIPWTWWPHEVAGENRGATKEIKDLFGGEVVFSAPKPTKLITKILELIPPGEDNILLDFFAGSGTSAEAVLKWNVTHSAKWRFLSIQLAEPLEPDSAAASLGMTSIAALCAERIRRAAGVLSENTLDLQGGQDHGFRYLRIDSQSTQPVFESPDDLVQASLADFADSLKVDRSDEDLLFQVLLDEGIDLTLQIKREVTAQVQFFSVAEDALIGCFADSVSNETIATIAKRRPLRVVFKDSGFANDAARINAQQIFREVSPETEVRVI